MLSPVTMPTKQNINEKCNIKSTVYYLGYNLD